MKSEKKKKTMNRKVKIVREFSILNFGDVAELHSKLSVRTLTGSSDNVRKIYDVITRFLN